MKFSTKRGIVVGVIFLSVIVGLVVHTGTGTESALGWRDIALICPVGVLETLAGAKGLALHAVILLAVTLLLGVVFGKAFCSWACPTQYVRKIFGVSPLKRRNGSKDATDIRAEAADGLGTADCINGIASDAADENADSTAPERLEAPAKLEVHEAAGLESKRALSAVGGKRDGLHLDSRHFVLLGALVSSFAFGFPVFCLICPVGLTFGLVIGLFNLVFHADASWGILVFLVVLVLELVVFRKWCTHLCPISALLSLLSAKTSAFNPKVDRAKCLREKGVDCRVCVEECPEQVDPHVKTIPECSKCGACADKCPAQAIALKLHASKTEKVH